jgi:pimeloyl-ACP methyl ester carboxylesterase
METRANTMTMSARRMLCMLLAVQGVAAGLLACAAVWLFDARLPLALLFGLASVILVRMAISINNFAVSARFASATPGQYRLAPGARVRLFLEEFKASMLYSSWFMPRGRPRTRIYPDSPLPPVLLLHGYGCNSGYWSRLIPLLDARHISHASIDLEPLTGSIDDYVPLTARAVEALCEAAHAPQAIIVGHSMGGLVARAYMRDHGDARVAHVFTLGTPHHGTALANLGPGRNALQMRLLDAHDNAWLRALADSETPRRRALITSIYTHHDNIVSPQTSSELPGARNIDVGGVGHVALGSNPRVLTRLMQEMHMLCAR